MNPLVGTYCNPLPLPEIPVGRGALAPGFSGAAWREYGDPSALRIGSRIFLFPSCGMVWYTDDLLTWKRQRINLNDVGWAPAVARRDGRCYLTASWEGSKIWTATDPLGHWDCLGDVKDETGEPIKLCDPDLFVDDDGTMYLYYSRGPNLGLFGVPLRTDDPTRFAAAPTHLFAFNPGHWWERFGEYNQNPHVSHLEGASILKRAGRYHLQYSAAGAEWRNYAVGCYVADRPLGPYVPQKRNPVLVQRHGLLNGCGHNCVVDDGKGGYWSFYTVLLRRFRALERRIAMDPVRFDEHGDLYVDGPSETPRFLDGTLPEGLAVVSAGQPARASSEHLEHGAEYAVDHYARTWWEADPADPAPTLTVDLQGLFTISGARLLFAERLVAGRTPAAVFRYLIEGSEDGKTWQTLADRRNDTFDGPVRYETWDAAVATHVRLTVTAATEGSPVGVTDFSVFGQAKGGYVPDLS